MFLTGDDVVNSPISGTAHTYSSRPESIIMPTVSETDRRQYIENLRWFPSPMAAPTSAEVDILSP